jgi:hypothetical protein
MATSKKRKSKDTPEKQHARFVETAKKAEADEAPDAMDKAFKKIDARRTQSDKNTKL